MSGESLLEYTIVFGGVLGDFIKKPACQGYVCFLGSFIAVTTQSFWSAPMGLNTFHSILSVTVIKTVNNNIKLIK